MTFIQLHKKDSDTPVWVNIIHLEGFADYEIWQHGKRYRVQETAGEIMELLSNCKK